MKRQDALRKVRTICERLDAIDPHTFPIQPLTLYLFGSTLTDNANPADVDLVLVYRDNPEISYSAGEITHMLAYEPRLLSHNRASVELRRGMKRVQLHMSPNSIEFWEYLPLFPQGNGIRVIWKPDWHWQNLIDVIEATPAPWSGPRTSADEARFEQEWYALSTADQQQRLRTIVEALKRQEEIFAELVSRHSL